MPGSILAYLLSHPWSLVAGVLLLGLCIFVHELGHYLAARWRGVVPTRFSIGFGPTITAWTDRRGTEWRLAWIVVGGYVRLPQLADLGKLEGGALPGEENLPPISWLDKIVVSLGGPVFNVLFALLLGVALWLLGEKRISTRIGWVSPTITLSDGREVPSPAVEAGLRAGDVIRTVDGRAVQIWDDVVNALVLGGGKADDGRRNAVLTVLRDGKVETITVHPRIATEDRIRRVGISSAGEMIVAGVEAGRAGARAGLLAGDRLVAINGVSILGPAALDEFLSANQTQVLRLEVRRGNAPAEVALPAGAVGSDGAALGVTWLTDLPTVRVPPLAQVAREFRHSYAMLWSLVNPRSDIGLSHMGGAVNILAAFAVAAMSGWVTLLGLTLSINVALAVFNLLPIPVLDGGHVVFATVNRLRGRPLPIELVLKIQGVFVVLLLSLLLYVNVNGTYQLSRARPVPSAAKNAQSPEPSPAK